MNLLIIKKRASRRSKPAQKRSRWLRLPERFFGINGIFDMDKPIHPLSDLLRQAYFNRYGAYGASIPYENLEHFSAIIWRRWSLWPESLLSPIFERLETAQEDDIESTGKFIGWIQKEIEREIGFKNFIVGVGAQTLDDMLFDAAIEQAGNMPNIRFHPSVWEAAKNLPGKIKKTAQQESIQCQDKARQQEEHTSPILSS